MPFSDDFLDRWEHIINEVSMTEVPLECLKKVVIKLEGRRQRTINLALLRRQGLDSDEMEAVLTRTLLELGDSVVDMDFMVDVSAVAKIVQPETDKILINLK
jgi:hypothetical protein